MRVAIASSSPEPSVALAWSLALASMSMSNCRYTRRWLMWDNRAPMHRARRFDRNEVRDVRRTTLAGDTPTVEQAPVA